MIDTSRRFLLRVANSPADLAATLIERSWPICSAFLLDEYVLVHAGTSSEAAAVYGAVKLGEDWPLLVASVELTDRDESSVRAVLEAIASGAFDHDGRPIDGVLWLDTLDDHACPFCS